MRNFLSINMTLEQRKVDVFSQVHVYKPPQFVAKFLFSINNDVLQYYNM